MGKILVIIFCAIILMALSLILIYRFFYLPPTPDSWVKKIPIAHRGYFDHKRGIPENSLRAFQRAVDYGYAMELDVWLTKDGDVIVYHDEDFKRLSNNEARLEDLTLKEIQSIPLMETKEVAPTLKQVFDLVAGQTPIYVEIKTKGHRKAGVLEEKVGALVDEYQKKYGKNARIAMLSFNPESLEWFVENRPRLPRGQSYDVRLHQKFSLIQIVQEIITFSFRARPHFFDIDHELLSKNAQKMLSYLRPLVSYNVKNEAQFLEAKKHVSNVIFENIQPKI